MDYLYQKLPKDLANIVEEYANDRTNYDKVIYEMNGIFTYRFGFTPPNRMLLRIRNNKLESLYNLTMWELNRIGKYGTSSLRHMFWIIEDNKKRNK